MQKKDVNLFLFKSDPIISRQELLQQTCLDIEDSAKSAYLCR